MNNKNTVMNAWSSTDKQRDINNDFIFHSDRGVKYASNKITHHFFFQ